MRFWCLVFFLFCFLALGSPPLFGAPAERLGEKEFEGVQGRIKISISETEISVAESLSLSMEVLVPEGFVARLPSFQDFGFSTDFNERSHRFRTTDMSPVEKILQDDGSTLLRQQFTLEPWLSGDYSILPLMISYFRDDADQKSSTGKTDKEGEGQGATSDWRIPIFHVMSDGIRVQVTGLGEERQELSDIFGQADYNLDRLTRKERRKEDKSDQELQREEEQKEEAAVLLKERQFPWWLLWGLLAVGLIGPLVWYLGRRKIIEFFSKPTRPAHDIAYEALDELRGKELLKNNMIKEFYYELSYIMRVYIGNRFQIYAVNQTTEEFFQQLLVSNPFDQTGEDILRQFSEHADTVKYSLHRPDSEQAMESLGIVQSFVDATKQEEGKEKQEARG